MTTGTSAGITGPDTNDKTCDEDFAPAGLNVGNHRMAQRASENWSADQSRQESYTPRHVIPRQTEQSSEDAANSGDTAIEQNEYCCRHANKQPSDQR